MYDLLPAKPSGLNIMFALLSCWQVRRSTNRQGRTTVLVSASATLTKQIDLGTQPLVINHLNINTYNQTNRFGKQLWEMKALIKESGNFRSEDEKRICLALAMQVNGALCPVKPQNVLFEAQQQASGTSSCSCPTHASGANSSVEWCRCPHAGRHAHGRA